MTQKIAQIAQQLIAEIRAGTADEERILKFLLWLATSSEVAKAGHSGSTDHDPAP